MEIHQKKGGPDYHRFKTIAKRSIEQNLRMKKFEARNGNFETSAVVKNQRAKQREQRSLGDCWQWKANGQCSKGDSCRFRHDVNKRAKSTQPNPSPKSSTQQSVRNASRPLSLLKKQISLCGQIVRDLTVAHRVGALPLDREGARLLSGIRNRLLYWQKNET